LFVIHKIFSGAVKVKKFTGFLIVPLLISAGLIVGCSGSSSAPVGPTSGGGNVQSAQAPIALNSAANYVVLAHTTITNSGPSTLCGDLGLSPGSSVVGAIVMSCGGVQDITNGAASIAQGDLTKAYNNAAGRVNPTLIAGNLGGKTLVPGLYKSTGSLAISSGDLTLDGQGNPNAVFIFQIASTLTTGSGRQVILTGDAQASNVFWQVGSSCAFGTTTSFVGTVMAHDEITFDTGAVLVGRALSEIAEVTMLTNNITMP
jgi:hypothetical protein